MDSGNSGSMQSSSGGSEEYDSRAESFSAFFNSNPSSHIGHGGPLGNQQQQPLPSQPPLQHQNHSSSAMFDPLSNYFDHHLISTRSTNPSPLLNLDGVWSKNLRSDPNCNDHLGGGLPTSQQALFLGNQAAAAQGRGNFPCLQNPPESGINKSSLVSGTGTSDSAPNNNNNNMVRNPKKRSRASRRAPTTVLTTDTTNFRAMVQEFTGIPAPPFTSSPFPRTRLDLFGTPSNMRSSSHLDPSPPHYLLRPFAQKLNTPTFPSTTPIATSGANNNNNNAKSSSTSINYQLPSELGLLKQPQQNLLNMQNPIFNFQSLLQTPPKYSLPNEASLKMGVLEEFGLNQGHVNNTNLSGLQNMVSSSSERVLTPPGNDNSTNIPTSWGERTTTTAGSGAGLEHDQSDLLRSINGSGYNSTSNNLQQRVSNGAGPENVAAARSEGMVESWICSSD